uniref:BTB domain-containing protein n=1 Tax=Arion vulgaris TaxID=1028688 RepID=A0A0B6ZN58_9EUPU
MMFTEKFVPLSRDFRPEFQSLDEKDIVTVTQEMSLNSCNVRVLRDESNFIQNVGQFYNQKDISDIILKIGKTKYYGHKFVLAKSSDVFRTMLYDKNWTQAGLPEIVLEETDECQAYFDTFLRFLYTAEVNISVESAVGILCLADKYSVTSLKNLCTQYMVEHTRSPLVKNALSWYSWSKALHMNELVFQCSKTIAWNVENILKSPEWSHMDIDFVSDMLKNGDLVIQREYTLFEALIEWLEFEEHLENYLDNAKKLLPLIRFPQMQVHELYAIEQCEMYKHEDLSVILDRLINKAYRFRSLCSHKAEVNVSFTDDFYLPRNYLDLSVDNVRMQNALRYGIQVDVRTYAGPVPSVSRDGEWKIAYRKSNDTWTLQIYCHESALVGGEARVQAALIIANHEDQVVQVEESDITICSRSNHLTMNVLVPNQDQCKSMAVLIKPLPK